MMLVRRVAGRGSRVLALAGVVWRLGLETAVPATGPVAPEPGTIRPVPEVDPFCRLTNGVVGAESGRRPSMTEDTRRMVEELVRLRDAPASAAAAYLNDRQIPVLQALLAAATNDARRIGLRLHLGRQWVFAGDPLKGLAEFEEIDRTVAGIGGRLDPGFASELRMQRAVALLRLGEQDNCLDRHTSESCLLPVAAGGRHRVDRGSRGAIAVLREQLALAPGDLRARWLLNLAHMTLGEWPERVPEPFRIPASVFAAEDDIGRFPDVAGSVGLDVDDLAGGCILDDFDRDGLIDVVASSWSVRGQLRYFRNRGDGRFEERTVAAGLVGLTSGLNIQQTDYDNDGWPDIWVLRGGWLGTAGRFPNSLLRNNGDGTFSDVTERVGLLSRHPTQASTWFDYDGDGWLDVFIGNETWDSRDPDPCELYHNNGDGTFSEVAFESGLRIAALVKGVTSGDYDNDGRPDLYLSCRDRANLLFRNDGPGGFDSRGKRLWRFRNVSAEAGVDERVSSFPTWFFDYDNDGDQDIYIVMGGAFVGDHYRNALFLNPGHGNHWLKLQCVGRRSNRAAIGTRITVTVATPSGPRSIRKTVNSGGSFGSSPFRQEFGLGPSTAITRVELVWPASGIRQVLTNLVADRAYRIEEGAREAVELDLPGFRFELPPADGARHGADLVSLRP